MSRTLPLLVLLLLPGCFPIELDVDKDGRLLIAREEGFFIFDPAAGKTHKVCGANDGKPVFGRFAPDGKNILTVSKTTRGLNEFRFSLVPTAGGASQEVFSAEKCAYVRFAPDGSQIAIARVGEKKEQKQELGEIHVVQLKDRSGKVVVRNVGVLFRWFADSKRLLIFTIDRVDDKQSHYQGNVAVLDIATGKTRPLVTAVVDNRAQFDLAPDNKKVLFTALKADKPGTDLLKGTESDMKLFEVDVASAELRPLNREAKYAIYSPNGKHVLIGSPPEGFSFDTVKLEIADAGLTKFTVAATDAHLPMISFGGEGVPFPGWVNDQTIYYFRVRHTYGTEGKDLSLMTVGIDGTGKKCVQPLIDLEAVK